MLALATPPTHPPERSALGQPVLPKVRLSWSWISFLERVTAGVPICRNRPASGPSGCAGFAFPGRSRGRRPHSPDAGPALGSAAATWAEQLPERLGLLRQDTQRLDSPLAKGAIQLGKNDVAYLPPSTCTSPASSGGGSARPTHYPLHRSSGVKVAPRFLPARRTQTLQLLVSSTP